MKKKKIIVPLVLSLAVALYWVFFHKDKTLRFIPDNADAVVLIDVKQVTGQYIFSFITHPSQWSGGEKKDRKNSSLKDSGVRIPDFLQIFHLKESRFSEWYTVLELKDPQKFQRFLKEQKFTDKGNLRFQKDQIFLMIDGDLCIAGTTEQAFEPIRQYLHSSSPKKTLHADQLILGTPGSISFISGTKIQNFSVELKDDEIEIKNNVGFNGLPSIESRLQQTPHFLEMELDAANVKHYARFFNKSIADSSEISNFRAIADLEQVNDTIISYEYDDNFNEVEKKSIQKITQPNYTIDLQSKIPEKTWEYFQSKKWINTENQFTAIPFQPNKVSRSVNGITIQSVRKPQALSSGLKENFILIRNNSLLYSSLKSLGKIEKKIISDIDYILYENKGADYRVKLKAKKGELPLILRW